MIIIRITPILKFVILAIDKTVTDCSCPTNFKCKDECSDTEKCEPFETTKNPSGKFNGLCVSNSFGKCRVTNDPWIHTFDGHKYFAPDWTKYLLTEYGHAFYNFKTSLNYFTYITLYPCKLFAQTVYTIEKTILKHKKICI